MLAGLLALLLAGAAPEAPPQEAKPAFVLVGDTPVISGELFVTLDDPAVLKGAPLSLLLLYDDGAAEAVATGEDGRVLLPDSRRPAAFQAILPKNGPVGEPIAFAGKGGHRIVLHLVKR